jgi:hypothetical protein
MKHFNGYANNQALSLPRERLLVTYAVTSDTSRQGLTDCSLE